MLWNTPGNQYVWPAEGDGKIIPVSEKTWAAVSNAIDATGDVLGNITDPVWEVVRIAIENDRKFPPNEERQRHEQP